MAYVSSLSTAQATRRIKGYIDGGADGFIRWASECILIPGPGGRVVPFELWPGQQDAVRELFAHDMSVCLKARQLGLTWIILAWWLFEGIYQPIQEHRIVSINEQKSADHLGRVRWMWDNLPSWTKPEVDTLNQSTIRFRDSGSIIRSLPSTVNAGRGDTLDGMLMDEDAFQPLAQKIVTSALPALEKRRGYLIRLSTANGYGTDHEIVYHQAKRGEGAYHPIFLSCYVDPSRSPEWREKLRLEMGDEYVNQELPENDKQAFLASGRPFFDQGMIEQSKDAARDRRPLFGYLEGSPPWHKIEFVREAAGELKVWELPQMGVKYVLFCDPSRGLETGDDTTIYVMRAGGRHEVARYKGKADIAEATDLMELLGHWYSYKVASVYSPEDMPALAAVEVNSFGIAIAQGLRERNYRNLFYQRNLVTGDIREDQPGWESSGKTRRLVLGAFQSRFRRGESIVLDTDTIDQMQAFAFIKGKAQAPVGGNDDCVIGRAGCDYLSTLDSAGEPRQGREKVIDTAEARELGLPGEGGAEYWVMKDQEQTALRQLGRRALEEI